MTLTVMFASLVRHAVSEKAEKVSRERNILGVLTDVSSTITSADYGRRSPEICLNISLEHFHISINKHSCNLRFTTVRKDDRVPGDT